MFTPIVEFIQARRFKFRPVYSFVMVLGICICSIAAFWQYEKALFYTQPKAQILHIQGSYFNEHSRYLDNQTHNGQVGYAVITPFLYDGTVYMVNRGFIAYKNRSELPKIEPVLGNAVLRGRLHVNHKPLLLNTTLIDPISERVQFVDRQAFVKLLNLPVKNEVFILNEGQGLLTKASAVLKSPQTSSVCVAVVFIGRIWFGYLVGGKFNQTRRTRCDCINTLMQILILLKFKK